MSLSKKISLADLQEASRLRHAGKDREPVVLQPVEIIKKPPTRFIHKKVHCITHPEIVSSSEKKIDFDKIAAFTKIKAVTTPKVKELPVSTPENPQKHPAVYTNIPSAYGIADELHGKKLTG